jgi:hypothetical protein
MKTFIFLTEKNDLIIFRVKHNIPTYIGTVNIQWNSTTGVTNEVASFLYTNKHASKNILKNKGKGTHYFDRNNGKVQIKEI